MIEDIKEKTDLEAYNMKRGYEKEIEKLRKSIKKAEDQLIEKDRKY